jgi:aminocarboxymuconate-semialdehyde decarboxylase
MTIDVHNHVIPRSALDLFGRDPGYGVRIEEGRWRGGVHVDFELRESFLDPDEKLCELDRNGIDEAIVSAAPPLFYYHVDEELGDAMGLAVNAGLAEFAAAGRNRLRWLAVVPLQNPDRAAEVLAEAAAAGAVGVEIGTSVAGQPLDEPPFDAFWSAAERLQVPVLVHPAYNAPHPRFDRFYLDNVIGNMLETTIAAERLICAGVLDRHEGLRLLLVHSGGYFPYQAGRLRHARGVRPELADAPDDPWRYLDRLWFDTITHDAAALRYLVERVGADRVVFGTDLPFDMAPASPVDEARDALPQDVFEAVTESNPRTLFGLAGDDG